jgi:hypothetical protein
MTTTTRNVGHDGAYQASEFFDDDAIDALAMSGDRPEWLMFFIRRWYRSTDRYAGVIDDARNGERTWL